MYSSAEDGVKISPPRHPEEWWVTWGQLFHVEHGRERPGHLFHVEQRIRGGAVRFVWGGTIQPQVVDNSLFHVELRVAGTRGLA